MFRFTIRELVLLTLTVAFGVGWWLAHRKATSLEAQARATEIGVAMMAERIEMLSDANTELAIERGLPVMVPVYSDDPSSASVEPTHDSSPDAPEP